MRPTAGKCIDNTSGNEITEVVLQVLQEIVSWRPLGRDGADIL